MSGTALIAGAVVQAPRLYRCQARILLLGALIPWLWNGLVLLSRSSLLPYLRLDLSHPGFMLTGLVVAWGLFRIQLLDIVPVARDTVVDSMGDGVTGLDVQDRVVDLNPAAQQITGRNLAEAVRQPASEVLAAIPELKDASGAPCPVCVPPRRTLRPPQYDASLRIHPDSARAAPAAN